MALLSMGKWIEAHRRLHGTSERVWPRTVRDCLRVYLPPPPLSYRFLLLLLVFVFVVAVVAGHLEQRCRAALSVMGVNNT